jgi:hypothetical protein
MAVTVLGFINWKSSYYLHSYLSALSSYPLSAFPKFVSIVVDTDKEMNQIQKLLVGSLQSRLGSRERDGLENPSSELNLTTSRAVLVGSCKPSFFSQVGGYW